MSRTPPDQGALWALLGVAALAAGAALSGRRGGRSFDPIEEGPLRYSASAKITLSCEEDFDDEAEDLEFDWEPGDDLPDMDDLEQEATSYFESSGEQLSDMIEDKRCHWNVSVSDVDVTPGWKVVPTLRGKPRIYHA